MKLFRGLSNYRLKLPFLDINRFHGDELLEVYACKKKNSNLAITGGLLALAGSFLYKLKLPEDEESEEYEYTADIIGACVSVSGFGLQLFRMKNMVAII